MPLKRFEDTHWFESCLPIEEIARRGVDTLRFGPMKPKGLRDPRTGEEPYACVQLRQENLMADAYGFVGFQNHLRYGEQERVLRLIPGLQNAEFLQFGQIHRNTFINSPKILNETLATQDRSAPVLRRPDHRRRGLCRIRRDRLARGAERRSRHCAVSRYLTAPRTSAIGAVCRYVSNVETKNFQPVNITFGLLEPLPPELRKKYKRKRERHEVQVERALKDWDEWTAGIHRRDTERQRV